MPTASFDDRKKRRRRIWPFFIVAAVLIMSVSTFGEGLSRPFRYYTDNNQTAFTYYSNASGGNMSLWGINTDDPKCELDINGTVCINRTGYYFNGVNLSSGGGGAPTTASYVTLGLDGGLTSERVLTAGAGITTIDTGANGIIRINVTATTCTSGNYSTFDGSSFSCSPDTGGANASGTVTSLTEGPGINLTPDTITLTGSIGIINLQACNSVTEYSVWNGSHWLCDNDGSGSGTVTSVTAGNGLLGSPNPIVGAGTLSTNATTCNAGNYTYWNGSAFLCSPDTGGAASTNYNGFTNTDGYINVTNSTTVIINWNISKIASSTITGLLTAADWSTFNSKGISNLTSVTVHNVTNFSIDNSSPHLYNLTLSNGTSFTGLFQGLITAPNVNVTNLSVTNGTTHTINLTLSNGTSFVSTFDDTDTFNTSAQMRAAINNSGLYNISIDWLNITNKAVANGSGQCGGSDKVNNVTLNSSGLYVNCSADNGGGSGGNVTSNGNGSANYLPLYSNSTNINTSKFRDNGTKPFYDIYGLLFNETLYDIISTITATNTSGQTPGQIHTFTFTLANRTIVTGINDFGGNSTYNGNGTAGYLLRATNTTNSNNSLLLDNGTVLSINGFALLTNQSNFGSSNLTSAPNVNVTNFSIDNGSLNHLFNLTLTNGTSFTGLFTALTTAPNVNVTNLSVTNGSSHTINLTLSNGTSFVSTFDDQGGLTGGVDTYPAIWSGATSLIARLINKTHINTSNAGSSGQVLSINSTNGLEWITSSGSGNVTATNISNNYLVKANSSSNLVTSNLVDNGSAVNFSNTDILGVRVASFYDVYDNGNSTNLETINWNNGAIQNVTLNATTTITFIAPNGGTKTSRLTLFVNQDSTGSRLVTWNTSQTFKWPGATAPTLTTTLNRTDICTFIYDGFNSTANYWGVCSLNFG